MTIYPVLLFLYDMMEIKKFKNVIENECNCKEEQKQLIADLLDKPIITTDIDFDEKYIFKTDFLKELDSNKPIDFKECENKILKHISDLLNSDTKISFDKSNKDILKIPLNSFIKNNKIFIMSFKNSNQQKNQPTKYILTPILAVKKYLEEVKKLNINNEAKFEKLRDLDMVMFYNISIFEKYIINDVANDNNNFIDDSLDIKYSFSDYQLVYLKNFFDLKKDISEVTIQLATPSSEKKPNLDNMISFIIYQKTIYCIDDKKDIFKIEGNPFGIFKSDFFLKDKKFIISNDMLIAYNHSFIGLFSDVVFKYSKNPKQLVDFLINNNDNYKNIDECELEIKSLKDELEDEIEEAYNEFLDEFSKIDITKNKEILKVLGKIHTKLEGINLKINIDPRFITYKNSYIDECHSIKYSICNLKENLVEYVRYFCDVTRAKLKLKENLEIPKNAKYQREIINIIKQFIS